MEFSKRPWGWYLTIYKAEKFKIKFLYFKKDKSCSLQRHALRDETWCWLFGRGLLWSSSADIINKHKLKPHVGGAAVIIPAGNWHQYMAHAGTLILEIQTGLCREDDIERKE